MFTRRDLNRIRKETIEKTISLLVHELIMQGRNRKQYMRKH